MDGCDQLLGVISMNEMDSDSSSHTPHLLLNEDDDQPSHDGALFSDTNDISGLSLSTDIFHPLNEPPRFPATAVKEEGMINIHMDNIVGESIGVVQLVDDKISNFHDVMNQVKIVTPSDAAAEKDKTKASWYACSVLKNNQEQGTRKDEHGNVGMEEILRIGPKDVSSKKWEKLCTRPPGSVSSDEVMKLYNEKNETDSELVPSNVIVIEFDETENANVIDDDDKNDDSDGDGVSHPSDSHKVLVEEPFKCDLCEKSFKNKYNLKSHMRIHTRILPEVDQFKCCHCDLTFKKQSTFYTHMRIHSGVKSYICSHCGIALSDSTSLRFHMRIHTGIKRPYTCSHCDIVLSNSTSLTLHMRTHTGERPYSCPFCDATFSRKNGVKSHIMTHHTGEKPFQCTQCPSTFNRSSHLRLHMSTHTGYKPHKCDKCQASFNQACNLKTHMRIHTGEKPFKCSECSKAFAQLTNLKAHLMTHIAPSERKYHCSKCSAQLADPNKLKEHMKTNHGKTDKRLFSCPGCKSECRYLGALHVHMKSCPQGQMCVKCDICGLYFISKTKLNSHKKSHSQEKPYMCSMCGQSFHDEESLKSHLNSQH